MIKVGDKVEIMDYTGSYWKWGQRYGIVEKIDNYCFTVKADSGETIRDVCTHFKPVKN